MTVNNKHFSALVLFIAFYLILFVQFPLQKALPGNTDTWLVIALSNTYIENIRYIFEGVEAGKSMYPAKNVLAYGESSIVVASIFIFFKLITGSDYIAYYFFISLLFSLSGFGVYLFSTLYLKKWASSLFSGFVFSCSNMMFAHIDDSIIILFFFSALSLYFFLLFIRNGEKRYLYFTALATSIQIYCSVYMFIYLSIMLLIAASLNHKKVFSSFKQFVLPVFLTLFLIFPWFFFYITVLKNLQVVTPFEPLYTIKMTSLNLIDLVLALPGNLIYGGIIEMPMNWGFVRHHNFHGLLLLTLASGALFKWNKGNRKLLIIIAASGFLLSLGPMLMVGLDELMPTPLYPFYHYIPILEYLRVTSRAFFIFSFAVSVLAAMSFEKITTGLGMRLYSVVVIIFFIIHFFENTPIPFKAFKYEWFWDTPKIYETINKEDNNKVVILNLPSYFSFNYLNWDPVSFKNPEEHIFKKPGKKQIKVDEKVMFSSSWDDIFEYNREIIYMNWQTNYRLNAINGVNGYFSAPRLIYQYHINKLPDSDSIIKLKNMGISHIVYHKNLLLKGEQDYLNALKNSEHLHVVDERDEAVLLKFHESMEKMDIPLDSTLENL